MEIKAELQKPYTDKQRLNFIVQQNHQKGYEIRETEEELQAWGYTDEELLATAKQNKYNEANNGAKEYLESGNALFELEEGKHIEATDGNIGKFTAFALAFVTGQLEPTDTVEWNTKEDENIQLNQNQVSIILFGLGAVQTNVWTNKFPAYLQAIEQAETVEEVNAIVIDYAQDIPEPTVEPEPTEEIEPESNEVEEENE